MDDPNDTFIKSETNSDTSVYCITELPDEIISIHNSSSMDFKNNEDDSKDVCDEKTIIVEEKKKRELDEFLMLSPIRKKIDKAKQPGYDCPECEKVNFAILSNGINIIICSITYSFMP